MLEQLLAARTGVGGLRVQGGVGFRVQGLGFRV